jgi:nitrite reductase/ring-hydroxylating ferredoxin subunit
MSPAMSNTTATAQHASETSHMTEEGASTEKVWELLAGLDPVSTKYPARARLGGEGIVILRTKSGFRGVQRSCPHMQATLMNAELTANDTMVRCPLHVFTFRLSDGKGVNCPGFRLKIYEVKEENGALYGRSVS